MPYVDIPSRDDYVSLWYITNSLHGNVGSFNPNKPTLILLHPLFLDSRWLRKHFDDPRLTDEFNIIAFDLRVSGRSRSRPSRLHDSWTDAADVAFACESLQLPPAHICAFESVSVNTALRFQALWPERVLSLTLCNVPPPLELQWVFQSYEELLQLWCYAEDLDSFEHAGSEVVTFMTGKTDEYELQDELISYWEINSPPTARLRIVELLNVVMNRKLLEDVVYEMVNVPVMIVQAESSPTAPLQFADALKKKLVNAPNDIPIYVVKGAKACLNILPGTASIVNQVLHKFLTKLPKVRSELKPLNTSTRERMKKALLKLGEIRKDSSFNNRDPWCPLSFTCVTEEVANAQQKSLEFYMLDVDKAYCPLGFDGRPMRRYSERKNPHWFHGDRHGHSYVGLSLPKIPKRLKPALPALIDPPVTPTGVHMNTSQSQALVTSEEQQEGRVRRAAPNLITVEKQVIKGSKAVTGHQKMPF